MPQILVDDNSKEILEKEKKAMRDRGITGASLSDAIRSLAAGGQYVVDH
jgi:hypothetical protein